ncbi:hypothetical protein [Ammoniphilus resinae]|uniref:Uncharacterized protein n=1 Tax=Ammoniphilus resinae TaxID=861532 RepID=A0ABS4GK38_9BACL|nr:hypothetical protein [Ammoniphilus resinae]MBP1930609.1 hypothetical protein [Ammoniphilus resinae]
MFGFRKKNQSYHLLILKLEKDANEGKAFYQVYFPAEAAGDFVPLMLRLQRSKLNTKEILGELAGFTILTQIEDLQKITVLDHVQPEAEPISYHDFANVLLNRLNNLLSEEESPEDELADFHEDLVFFIGELTLAKDGSF